MAAHMSLLTEELWKACAGTLVEVPRNGERVLYFPQGHLEHLEACINEELDHSAPLLKPSSKILCRVVDIKLKAENDTDEVFAEVVLEPEENQTEPQRLDICHEPARPRVFAFAKTLTASDASSHGSFSIPIKNANECLPPLDTTQPNQSQELVTRDIHGQEWRFIHRFRGQPTRHLLTTGWNAFVTAKRLVSNDSFVFLRGEDGELRVGVRHVSHQQNIMPASIVTPQNMHLGILATVSEALLKKSSFVVHYKPRTSRFIIRVNKYLESVNNCFAVGMRFKMRFETDVYTDVRFTGEIVGIENFSPHWKNSTWRSLKVRWDEMASIPMPERVSPWEIEPFSVVGRATVSEPTTNKRPRASEMNGASTSRTPPPSDNTSSGCFLFGVDLRKPPLG